MWRKLNLELAAVMADANRMTKAELITWLQNRHVEFPPSATVRHLRILFEQVTLRDKINAENDQQNGGHDEEADSANEEERELDAEIRVLQKRKFIADLRREIAAIEAELNVAQVAPIKPPDFRDIKYSVPCFRGGESYDAEKWIDDFEQACDSVHGDDEFRLMCVRRLMEPGYEGELFLRVDRSKTSGVQKQFLGELQPRSFSVGSH